MISYLVDDYIATPRSLRNTQNWSENSQLLPASTWPGEKIFCISLEWPLFWLAAKFHLDSLRNKLGRACERERGAPLSQSANRALRVAQFSACAEATMSIANPSYSHQCSSMPFLALAVSIRSRLVLTISFIKVK